MSPPWTWPHGSLLRAMRARMEMSEMKMPKGGRPVGARNKLQAGFLRDLAEAWEAEGKGALKIMIREHPEKFVQVCASLMPKEVSLEVAGPLSEMSDDELLEALQAVKQLRASAIAGEAIDVGTLKVIEHVKDK
jgi:hypothetical protein